MREVAIIGVGCTAFGELWDSSFRDIFIEAGARCLMDAGIEGEEIDGLYGGNMSAGSLIDQEHIGALIADYAGLTKDLHIPSTRVEAADASGGLALHHAVVAVASGHYDIVIAAGVEKMTDVSASDLENALISSTDREWEGTVGATLTSLYAMMAQLHMHRYGTTRDQLAQVAVKNHHNATMNPNAQFRKDITIDMVMNSPLVSDPLRVFDCAPTVDGAAAVVLAPAEIARKYTDTPVYIKASSHAGDTLSLHDRRDMTVMDSTVYAARRAYEAAGVSPGDIDVAEVHDSYSIAEIISIEDLGFAEKGKGGAATENGITSLDGDIPVNPGGGLKACGHPLGATGIRQAVEIALQLRGDAGEKQVKDAEIGLSHNVGGTGGTAVVHIMSR